MSQQEGQKLSEEIHKLMEVVSNGKVFEILGYDNISKILKLDEEGGIKFIMNEMLHAFNNAGYDTNKIILENKEVRSLLVNGAKHIYKYVIPFKEF